MHTFTFLYWNSQLRVILAAREDLATFWLPREIWEHLETFFISTTLDGGWRGDTTCIWWIKARDVAKHPTTHRTASHNKESSSSKCPWCRVAAPDGHRCFFMVLCHVLPSSCLFLLPISWNEKIKEDLLKFSTFTWVGKCICMRTRRPCLFMRYQYGLVSGSLNLTDEQADWPLYMLWQDHSNRIFDQPVPLLLIMGKTQREMGLEGGIKISVKCEILVRSLNANAKEAIGHMSLGLWERWNWRCKFGNYQWQLFETM